mmetsp:Transcript_19463/g.22372  ORF Transcript_19463/g.22372 Transcript_19463/m.22372 type:complete len:142 (-) Transcript_19463:59-484(-)
MGICIKGDGSEPNIKGEVDVGSDEGFVNDVSQLTVTGTITGTINSQNGPILNAQSCDNVTSIGGSTYNTGPQNIDINGGGLFQNSQTLSLTYNCSSGGSASASFSDSNDVFSSTIHDVLFCCRCFRCCCCCYINVDVIHNT